MTKMFRIKMLIAKLVHENPDAFPVKMVIWARGFVVKDALWIFDNGWPEEWP